MEGGGGVLPYKHVYRNCILSRYGFLAFLFTCVCKGKKMIFKLTGKITIIPNTSNLVLKYHLGHQWQHIEITSNSKENDLTSIL